MSSNAALSAARRRRVGQPQVQQQSVSQQPTQQRTQQQQQPRNMMTPVDILKQHHNDISKIKERLDIVEKTNNDDNKDEENKDLYTKIMTEVNRNIDTKFKNNMKSEIDNTINGKINDITKLPAKLGSSPIFINNSILYLSKKNKLIILN